MRRIACGSAALLALAAGCGADAPIEWPELLPDQPAIAYPVGLWDDGVESEVLLLVRVDEEGAVDSVAVERTSGHAEFDSAAIAGARGLRFRPGRKGDQRVSLWVRLPVKFTRAGGAEFGEAEEGGP
ncbi:MAG TPA: energy transducer TonB [Nannocystis sp.]|jgi:TonB family protein